MFVLACVLVPTLFHKSVCAAAHVYASFPPILKMIQDQVVYERLLTVL